MSTGKVSQAPPRPVRTVEHRWIPLRDGRRLGARLWLPEDAQQRPVPALLEYHPYGKGGAQGIWDPMRHAWFAAHGYASVRVDLAGSGDSDGVLLDEYLPQERHDAVEVIEWLAHQPWCDGAVGMFGISWGGFNSLQVAALRPPALKAIVSACASDDRYADDVHYLGGCVIGLEMLPWATTMLALNGLPPDPSVVGDEWRDRWLERLNKTAPLVETWLAHQNPDDYWGSPCESYSAIGCPVLLIGGWADGYRDAVLRMLASLRVPAKGIVGPWGHAWPYNATPGPAIGILQEMLRWWDRWLKGQQTGVTDDPPLRAWMQDAVRPCTHLALRPGRWLAEPAWPSPNVSMKRLYLGQGTLEERQVAATDLSHAGRLVPASDQGPWCAAGRPADHAGDQQAEDGQSLAFTSAPLEAVVEILGRPEVCLRLSVDQRVAQVAVRLCDVWPDGASTLVTRGLLNLNQRTGSEPADLTPGEPIDARVKLQAVAYRFPTGHRLRVAISSSAWPLAWPSPVLVTLSLDSEQSNVELPVRHQPESEIEVSFSEPESAPPDDYEMVVDEAEAERAGAEIRRWSASGLAEIMWPHDSPELRLPNGSFFRSEGRDVLSIVEGDPLSAKVTCHRTFHLGSADGHLRVEATATMSSTADDFVLDNELDAFENDVPVAGRHWQKTIARDHV